VLRPGCRVAMHLVALRKRSAEETDGEEAVARPEAVNDATCRIGAGIKVRRVLEEGKFYCFPFEARGDGHLGADADLGGCCGVHFDHGCAGLVGRRGIRKLGRS